MVFEVTMSDKANAHNPDHFAEDLWSESHIDLDARTLIDMQVAMADPSARRIRGKCFSQQDRVKIRGHIKRITELFLVPFIKQKIRNLEENVFKTRKTVKQKFLSAFGFKAPERGENDGLRSNFRMNKSELELRNLIDLAFVFQDYETVSQNAYIPLKDFRSYKAYRFAGSCQELVILSSLVLELLHSQSFNLPQLEQSVREGYNLFMDSQKPELLIKYSLMISDMYEVLELPEQSANIMVKIANQIPKVYHYVALFYEQAAFKFLKKKMYRKFAYYTA